MTLMTVCDLSFAYDKKFILKDIEFSVNKGEVTCILGPNGCGKTTLLDCLMGYAKYKKGNIDLKGRNLQTLRPHQVGKIISYVPQDHKKTFPYRVIDVVLMGRASYISIYSRPSNEDISIAEDALSMVGMSDFRNRPYTMLSGGEGQLVLLARALAQKTPLLVLDEPTAHLDFQNEIIFLDTIINLVNKSKISVIMATHFLNHPFIFQNRGVKTNVALMRRGEFIAFGSPSQVLTEENMKRVYQVNAKILSYPSQLNDKYLNYILPISTVS